VPLLTLAVDGTDRVMFDGAYVVDEFSLVMKALFLLAGYVVVLLSTNYVAEGDYWENEYYGLLLASLMGMVMMASARDLVSIFVALELLSIPAYLLVAWRKRDLHSTEAGLKYYLMGVFASAVMLYGMSLLYGVAGSTMLSDIGDSLAGMGTSPAVVTMGIVFVVAGFAFKVSAVPFHTWAPDVYEGAPTPVTAFLSVASKAAGFVALLVFVFVGFYARSEVWEPLFWILAALSMTVGNLVALRQTNVVRLMAYSGIAQTGFMIAPLAVAGHGVVNGDQALSAVVTYLVIYTAMNLGAFTVVIALARRSGSAELTSFNGAFQFAPGLTVAMSVFLFSLAGIPPLGGWFAKFEVFRVLATAGEPWGYALAIVGAVNSVVALYYYASLARRMWADDPVDRDLGPVPVTPSLMSALTLCGVVTLVFGVVPQVVARFTDVSLLALGG
jgi:NADH-quinone oxidoreductase subunit N